MISDMSQPSSQALWKGLLPSHGLGMRLFPLTWLGNEVNCLPSRGLRMRSIVCSGTYNPHKYSEKNSFGCVAEYKIVLMQKYKEAVKDEAWWTLSQTQREQSFSAFWLFGEIVYFVLWFLWCVWSLFIAIICAKSSSMVKVGKSKKQPKNEL